MTEIKLFLNESTTIASLQQFANLARRAPGVPTFSTYFDDEVESQVLSFVFNPTEPKE